MAATLTAPAGPTYTLDFDTFEAAKADRERYLALAAHSKAQASRARSTETAAGHRADAQHYTDWAAYCGGEMGRLSFS
jgi:hypothetical protein